MIYTSYFARWRKYSGKDYNLVAITYNKPAWFNGGWLEEVAPPEKLVKEYKNNNLTEQEYTNIYIEYLDIHKTEILNKIKVISEYDNYVLLCYEAPGKFCHRHVLAEWLRNNGYFCSEY